MGRYSINRLSSCVLGMTLLGTLIVYLLPVVLLRPTLSFGPVGPELKSRVLTAAQEMDGAPVIAESRNMGPTITDVAKELTPEQLLQYEEEGYLIVRKAIGERHIAVLRDLFEHLQDNRNLLTKTVDTLSCSSFMFGAEKAVPELAMILFRLNLHWVAQKLLQAEKTVLMNSILHYNPRDCGFEGSVLSTHNDYFSLPFSINRKSQSSFFGDNGYVAQICAESKLLSVTYRVVQSCGMGCRG